MCRNGGKMRQVGSIFNVSCPKAMYSFPILNANE